jgi:hypothetical protein
MWRKQLQERDVKWSEKVLKMKPRFPAEGEGRMTVAVVGEREGREILTSCWQTNEKKFSFGRVRSEEIGRHPVGDVLKSKMKVGDSLLKFIRTERHEKLSVISIQMVVEGVRRDEMIEGVV